MIVASGLLRLRPADVNAQAGYEIQRQAWISDRCNVLIAAEILRLHIVAEPGKKLVAGAEIEAEKAVVEISVRENQRVELIQISPTEEC
jgi:hypothetical protein